MQLVVAAGLLELVRALQQLGFLQIIAYELQTYGQTASQTCRQAHAGQASQRSGQGKNIGQIIGHGVLVLLAQFPRCAGRNRGGNHIANLEGILEVLRNQAADLLRLDIVGIVITVRQHKAADEDAALKTLEGLGATLVPISLPHTELAVPAYYLIAPAEASSNLSRYDGVKFGHRAQDYRDLADMYAKTRSEGFGAEVQRRILIGSFVLSHGYYDAYYVKAQQIRRLIAQDFQNAFQVCDVIAAPVAPSTAWKLGEKNQDPVANYLADIFTLPASLAGLPCMSLPAGLAGGLPVGLQLIGNYLQEAQLLQSAHQFQQASSHHQLHPTGF